MTDILERCRAFNALYKLPIGVTPSFEKIPDVPQRLKDFKKTISDEVCEIDDISPSADPEKEIDILVEISDLLADICVYCISEAVKYGIPLDKVVDIVMDSNMSKLGEDGLPIYDEAGKVLKGPNYWKPEPRIKEFLTFCREKKKKFDNEFNLRYVTEESAS